MLSVFYGLITKNYNMELKDLEEMFKMEQELDIPHRDRWYNKDFDKRELEAEQSVKNCNIPDVSNRRELLTTFRTWWWGNREKATDITNNDLDRYLGG